jgi:hypothetical protein
MSKLNTKCSAFFQRPKSKICNDEDEVWYENKPLGVHKIDNMMKGISMDAQLSKVYTNHCLRATASTILANAGIESRQICSVTGHKNIQSLTSYVQQPTLDQRKSMCDILHKFGREKQESESNMAVMNVPSSTSTATSLEEFLPKSVDKASASVTNTIASHTTHESMFSGAQFLGSTTINVMVNKN